MTLTISNMSIFFIHSVNLLFLRQRQAVGGDWLRYFVMLYHQMTRLGYIQYPIYYAYVSRSFYFTAIIQFNSLLPLLFLTLISCHLRNESMKKRYHRYVPDFDALIH